MYAYESHPTLLYADLKGSKRMLVKIWLERHRKKWMWVDQRTYHRAFDQIKVQNQTNPKNIY